MLQDKCTSAFYFCSCHGEGIQLDYWSDDASIYLSLWKCRSWNKPS